MHTELFAGDGNEETAPETEEETVGKWLDGANDGGKSHSLFSGARIDSCSVTCMCAYVNILT